jgi:hypothetical protein
MFIETKERAYCVSNEGRPDCLRRLKQKRNEWTFWCKVKAVQWRLVEFYGNIKTHDSAVVSLDQVLAPGFIDRYVKKIIFEAKRNKTRSIRQKETCSCIYFHIKLYLFWGLSLFLEIFPNIFLLLSFFVTDQNYL